MSFEFLAKSYPPITIAQHTADLLILLDKLREKHPDALDSKGWDLLHRAAYCHDMGKTAIKFQKKIYEKIGRPFPLKDQYPQKKEIPHGYLSPAFIKAAGLDVDLNEMELRILYKAVFYHHSRDFSCDDMVQDDYYKKILIEIERLAGNHIFDNFSVPESLKKNYLVKTYKLSDMQEDEKLQYARIKGLLNKLDFAASGIESEGILACEYDIEESPITNAGYSVADLTLQSMKQDNYALRDVQEYMQAARGKNIVVIASTGVGKTEAALLWIGDQKAFYTLPLKVSINAIYARVKGKIGYERAALLHSDAFSQYLTETKNEKDEYDFEEALSMNNQTKLLVKPLTFCTIDQIFKFVFFYNGGELPLATLSYSCLVLDEIQMYSPGTIAILLVGLRYITKLGGSFAIITATFPKILEELMRSPKLNIPFEMAPKKYYVEGLKYRHRIRLFESTKLENYLNEIIESGKTKRVLLIANTVKKAQILYDLIREKSHINNLGLLHSRFIKRDRAILEGKIQDFAPNNPTREPATGIWISTQIVEASLDIDFDVLYTQMCSIDSLLQRMGRVYRSRVYGGNVPNIFIFDDIEECTAGGKIIDKDIYKFSLQAVKSKNNNLLSEEDKFDMVDRVYDPACNCELKESNYYKQINTMIAGLLSIQMYEMRQNDANLRDIMETKTVIPEKIFRAEVENNLEMHDLMRRAENKDAKARHELMENLRNLSLSVPAYMNFKTDQEVYPKSQIYRCKNKYAFDASDSRGLLAMEFEDENRFM